MDKLTVNDLMTLEEYARNRAAFRSDIMQHKKSRQLAINKHARLYFEDRRTVHYQIQEMLRIEKIFEPDGIDEELAAYNPLIPDGSNLKATLMLEYSDPDERKIALESLKGVEDKVWLQVEGDEKVYPICDEDLERDNEEKTSSVHFLRFELSPSMIIALKKETPMRAGVDHPNMAADIEIREDIRQSLTDDLDSPSLN
ncbi:hypothetical protein CS022_09300 [Veronia nyctiphanis]|uniref:DUF3501 family protein n=1 Tax=Veronia nyctiphanis TaxID=1278244 RepID=A0A4Q0YW73_9GAMM|nr:DUF3501 family protein [Veronia nyctiphanis]RXJ73439.1 hypothetical protein CS022_09300 [Veronia nyctiphanis]